MYKRTHLNLLFKYVCFLLKKVYFCVTFLNKFHIYTKQKTNERTDFTSISN